MRTLMSRLLATLILSIALGGSAMAAIQTIDVEYEAGGQPMRGYMAWDDSLPSPRPGIMVIHEFWGLNDYAKKRTRDIAELGYVGFAVDMYGAGKVATEREGARAWAGEVRGDPALMKTRFLAAYTLLKEHELVRGEPVGSMGYCFGGGVSLNMALEGIDLAGVVSFHGSLPAPTLEHAKSVKGSILVCNGKDDSGMTTEVKTKFMTPLDEADVDYVFVDYANAVHTFTNPATGNDPSTNSAYNEKADKRSWAHMEEFWEELLGDPREDDNEQDD